VIGLVPLYLGGAGSLGVLVPLRQRRLPSELGVECRRLVVRETMRLLHWWRSSVVKMIARRLGESGSKWFMALVLVGGSLCGLPNTDQHKAADREHILCGAPTWTSC